MDKAKEERHLEILEVLYVIIVILVHEIEKEIFKYLLPKRKEENSDNLGYNYLFET